MLLIQSDQLVLSTNLLLQLDVSLHLVTGELFQKTVDVTSATYKHLAVDSVFVANK